MFNKKKRRIKQLELENEILKGLLIYFNISTRTEINQLHQSVTSSGDR